MSGLIVGELGERGLVPGRPDAVALFAFGEETVFSSDLLRRDSVGLVDDQCRSIIEGRALGGDVLVPSSRLYLPRPRNQGEGRVR